jgi:hypothetical protein
MKTFIQTSKTIIIALAVVLAVSYAQAEWNDPSVSPTGGNTPTPINVSSSNQGKVGGFSALNLVSGNKTISPTYCLTDTAGNERDCISNWPGGGGGTSVVVTDLIAPDYINGYSSYTGPSDVSQYDFIEVGVFDKASSGNTWDNGGTASGSTMTPVRPNSTAAVNSSGQDEDSFVLINFDGSENMTLEFRNNSNGTPRIAFVRGISI